MLLYFVRGGCVCSITLQPITAFSLCVRLERRENNPTRSTIWLNIWALLNPNTRVLLNSSTTPVAQPVTHSFSHNLTTWFPTSRLPLRGTHLIRLLASPAPLLSPYIPQHYFLNKELFRHQKVKTWLPEPYKILFPITKFHLIYS